MGGDAGVGHALHFFGSNLYFDGNAVHPNQGGVQRLVAVGLGDCDVVFEAANARLVQPVHGAEHAITVVDALRNHAKSIHVHDLGKGLVLIFHLAVNRVGLFFPADHLALQAEFVQARTNGGLDFLHHALSVTRHLGDGLFEPAQTHGVQGAIGEFLHLRAQLVHPQTIGNGGVDIQSFPANATAFFWF